MDGTTPISVTPASVPLDAPRHFALPTRRTLIGSGVAIAAALLGVAWIVMPASSESTDDAYIEADTVNVAPKVRGLVAEMLVKENQAVHAGDPLLRIDAEEFDARVKNAKANLADSEAGVAAAYAALQSLEAEKRLAAANVVAASTAIRSAQAQSEHATSDRIRFDSLVESGAVAKRDADIYRTAAITAEQDAQRFAALLDVSHQAESVVVAKKATIEANLLKAQAGVERARSQLELAKQDQRHALIVAPINGVVGNRQVQPGDYVQPGTHLLTLVPLQDLYVTANFKETQTTRMVSGQLVTVRADALPGHVLTGTVESIAPGSGSQFALLPFEPGTGNFTKIVQRLGVRVHLDPNQEGLDRLRPGMSVTARVALKDRS